MRARLLAENPNDIVFTMKISMTAGEWEALRDALDAIRNSGQGDHNVYRLISAVSELLSDARKTFWCDEPDGKEVT